MSLENFTTTASHISLAPRSLSSSSSSYSLSPASPASPSTSPSDSESCPIMASAASSFQQNVSYEQLATHSTLVCEAFDEALCDASPISMLPNYEISPSGNECGDFLVVDLGGSTLRVAVISIAAASGIECYESRNSRISIVTSKSWTVENSCKVVNKDFFAWIGAKIVETLADQSVLSSSSLITTGITWSFPLESIAYNKANIFHMAKGFVIDEDIVGRDLKELLESTMSQTYGIRIDVQSIINDSLAVFSAARFLDPSTMLAMVLGTGLNFCCQLAASDKISPKKLLHDEDYVLFNTETSLFGHTLIPSLANRYDCIIDSRFAGVTSFLPHMSVDPETNTIFQPFELLASGRYLPELARLVLVDVIAKKEIFANQKNFESFSTRYQGITGELLCYISESKDDFAVAERVEKCFHWAPRSVSLSDVASLRLLVTSIIRRAAFIVAIAIVAYVKLLARHNGKFSTGIIAIGYVGSVMEYFSELRRWVLEFVNKCADVSELGVRVTLQSINESSLVGTAIAAASQCARSQ
ncbi:hypothetical protein JCM33374_g1233 [Metschnikowia sp. JCM 33374]|nr:hypothetical protein JCM33374_g1233 [Metschnikowia sp. JCM 33374]